MLGQGAFGSVWRARDADLGRDVAVKIPRPGVMGGPEFEERFLREARSAANLKHEGIVAVHEIGRYDGTMYVVSDLVEGVSLAEWLTGTQPTFRESAELVAQLAESLDYAHRQGIVHRDLKPANVMLKFPHPGDAERPWMRSRPRPVLMDFGLAKREAAEITITRDGRLLGTPAYMSPEQARGESHLADSRSDVYSLGVILYELLTRERPFRGVERMVLHQVLHDEPRPPRKLNDKIPRDLETIALKCLAKEPGRRYGSAGELAEDLRLYLNREPICARPTGRIERAWRWAQRNRRVAGLMAAVFLMLVAISVGASIAAIVVNYHRVQADQATARAKTANSSAQESARQASENAKIAREQSQLALKTLQSVIVDIQTGLKNVPGAGKLRRKLLQTALARLQEVSDQFASRPAIDRNTQMALINLGDVFLQIGAGSPGDSESDGPLTAAQTVYQQSFEIAQQLVAADPEDAAAQRSLFISLTKLGDVQLEFGHVTKALGSYQKGHEICVQLAKVNLGSEQAQDDLAISYTNLGDVELESGQLTDALGFYQQALDIHLKLASADPSNSAAQRDLSTSYGNLGFVRLQAGQTTEALSHFQDAFEVDTKLAALNPSDPLAQFDLSLSMTYLGAAQLELGRIEEAIEQFQNALAVKKKLAAADPGDAQHQFNLAAAYDRLGHGLSQTGKLAEALGFYHQGVEILQKLMVADPDNAMTHFWLSCVYQRIAECHRQKNELAITIQYYSLATAAYGRFVTLRGNDNIGTREAQADLRDTLETILQMHKSVPKTDDESP